VKDGQLQLIKNTASRPFLTASSSAMVVGGNNADQVILFHAAQIADNAPVTLTASGKLDLNDLSDAVGALTLKGGSIVTGAGTLTLNGNVTLIGKAGAFLGGNVNLGAVTRTITVPAKGGLYVSAAVSGGGGLTKRGAGS